MGQGPSHRTTPVKITTKKAVYTVLLSIERIEDDERIRDLQRRFIERYAKPVHTNAIAGPQTMTPRGVR